MNRCVSILLLLSLSGASAADGLNYTFVEAGYSRVYIDNPDVDGDAFSIGGSYAVSDQFHLFGSFSSANFDFSVDLTDFDLGIGFNTPIADSIDVVATLAYVYTEADAPGFNTDDSGYGLGVGLRALVSPQVELHGGVQYVDLSDSGSDTALGAGFRFNFNERFSLGLAGSWSADVNSYTLAGRMYF